MIKGEEGDTTMNATDIEKIREYCEYLYANILENLEEMGKFYEMEMGCSRTTWGLTPTKN